MFFKDDGLWQKNFLFCLCDVVIKDVINVLDEEISQKYENVLLFKISFLLYNYRYCVSRIYLLELVFIFFLCVGYMWQGFFF